VRVYDFLSEAPGRALPYRVYDLPAHTAGPTVRIDLHTAAFAVQRIRRSLQQTGWQPQPSARRLTMPADGRRSHGPRARQCKPDVPIVAS